MAKEPWEEKIYESDETNGKMTRSNRKQSSRATSLLTVMLGTFFVIVIAIFAVVIYASNGGSGKNATKTFYTSSKSQKSANKTNSNTSSTEAASTSSSTTTTESSSTSSTSSTSSSSTDDTITVNSGEGEASIASRAGISVEKLEELNPDHMTTGSWYANPGDEVKIK